MIDFSYFSSLLDFSSEDQTEICSDVSQPRMTPQLAHAQSFFPGDVPAHTISMQEWRRRAGVRSFSIACLSNKKIIINFNYYLKY